MACLFVFQQILCPYGKQGSHLKYTSHTKILSFVLKFTYLKAFHKIINMIALLFYQVFKKFLQLLDIVFFREVKQSNIRYPVFLDFLMGGGE